MLTIAYMTNRLNPRFQWFGDSLVRELGGDIGAIKLVVVDYHAEKEGRGEIIAAPRGVESFVHCPPKPTVWQGKHRLTKRDYFAASNARNTAICHAPDGHVAFVDDLSVLMPGWYEAVKEAIAGNYIMLGCYAKVYKLVVENGEAQSWMGHAAGVDSRLQFVKEPGVTWCSGNWMFGCSLCAPVEALLKINGFDEDCDCVGGEDYCCGIMMERAGYRFGYDQRAITLESEEGHHEEPSLARLDKGASPNDKSHAMLNMVKAGRSVAPNYFGEGGIRAVREKVLNGEPFPITQIPQHDWFDGQPLAEM